MAPRFHFHHQRSGQAVTEYILVVLFAFGVVISLGLLFSESIFTGVESFAQALESEMTAGVCEAGQADPNHCFVEFERWEGGR